MARGGYVGLDVALNRVFAVVTSRREAAQMIADALISKALAARGCLVTHITRPRPKGVLVDLASSDLGSFDGGDTTTYGTPTDIDPAFWSSVEDLPSWDGTGDRFADLTRDEPNQYARVTVREKDLNALIKRRAPQPDGAEKPKRERRRKPTWDQWVAAVACIAHEHKIHAGMKHSELLNTVTARLHTWGFDEMPTGTVGPAASAILNRYGSNPPVKSLIP